MKDSGQKDRAYPRSDNAKGCFLVTKCIGGKGGGGCATVINAVRAIGYWNVPKFNVFNRRMVVFNGADGFHPFTDGGQVPGFPETCRIANVPQNWYIAFSADGNLTDREIQERGTLITETGEDLEIEVLNTKLPQPTDLNWEGKIYFHLYWGNPLLVNTGNFVLRIVKHDYDVKI